jgi:hypothetical protein
VKKEDEIKSGYRVIRVVMYASVSDVLSSGNVVRTLPQPIRPSFATTKNLEEERERR